MLPEVLSTNVIVIVAQTVEQLTSSVNRIQLNVLLWICV